MYLPNVEAERVRRQISRDDFAAMLNVSRRTVRNWQNGTTELPLSKLLLLSRAWGLSADYLLGLEATPKARSNPFATVPQSEQLPGA